MSFTIIRNDIAQVCADAIVNAANHAPVVGYGVDSRIHLAAGPRLLEARKEIGFLAPGQAALTPAFSLPARYVIHAVTPHWQGGDQQEAQTLRRTYDRCLELALTAECRSIAFPLLAAGNHGFPRALALQTAIDAFRAFVQDHELDIILVVFDQASFRLSVEQFPAVSSFIDDRLEEQTRRLERKAMHCLRPRDRGNRRRDDLSFSPETVSMAPAAPQALPQADLNALLRQQDAGFAETLVSLIEKSGKKNSEIYKKANVDKKLFSKIINNVNYHPSKPTAVAFAIALELDLAQTRDLIGRAGFALTHSSKFDIIIEYFISRQNYDLFEINEVLFSFDQVLLGV